MTDPVEPPVVMAEFQARLRSGATPLSIVREFITHGASAVMSDLEFARLREHIASRLLVAANQDVFMVGSAKIGFSIKPRRRYGLFGDDSDVDIAVVSQSLYNQLWKEARQFHRQGGLWDSNEKIHFKNDHLNGVIKPYVLPSAPSIPTKAVLFELSAEIQNIRLSLYPVSFAIWHDMAALEEYQAVAVRRCREDLQP